MSKKAYAGSAQAQDDLTTLQRIQGLYTYAEQVAGLSNTVAMQMIGRDATNGQSEAGPMEKQAEDFIGRVNQTIRRITELLNIVDVNLTNIGHVINEDNSEPTVASGR